MAPTCGQCQLTWIEPQAPTEVGGSSAMSNAPKAIY